MRERYQLCTFDVAGLSFGIEVEDVQEVIRYQEMTPVPLAAGFIAGLINLRGQIVTAIDLRHRLALPPLSKERQPMNVVLRPEAGAVSLLVDEIGDVLDVAHDSFERPPDALQPSMRRLVRGIFKLQSGLLLLLDRTGLGLGSA
jgi:purine-binding chemotaxis protein CheW